MNHHSASTSSASPEELIANIHKLMDEVEAIMARPENAIVEDESGRDGTLRDRIAGTVGRMGEWVDNSRRNVVDTARRTDEAIRTHPYQSLAIALGLGVLFGACLRRRPAD